MAVGLWTPSAALIFILIGVSQLTTVIGIKAIPGGYWVTISQSHLSPMARLNMFRKGTPIGLKEETLRYTWLSGQIIAMAFLQTEQVVLN